MFDCLALLLIAVVVQQPAATPQSVLRAARETAEQVDAYHVYGTIVSVHRGRQDFQPVPIRPAPLPTIDADKHRTEYFEDRFDRDIGRSLVKLNSPDANARPTAALTRQLSSNDNATTAVTRDSIRDFYWLIQPKYAGFNLMDMLESHPNVRLSSLQGVHVVDIPFESLIENSEFGVRMFIDPRHGSSISGIDLYVVSNGEEHIFFRVDVELMEDNGHWFPVRALEWSTRPKKESDRPTPTDIRVLTVDWGRSHFGKSLNEAQVQLSELTRHESKRDTMHSGWELVLYQQQPVRKPVPMPRSVPNRIIWLIAVNMAVLIGIAVWLYIKRYRRA